MDTIRTEHDINELKLQSLQAEVDRVVHEDTTSNPSAASGIPNGSANVATTSPSTLQAPSNNAPVKPSRSPVDIASQLFSRNKGSNKKKSSNSPKGRGSRTPNPNHNASSSGNANNANINHLKDEIHKTQDSEMKLVSSAIGINPDGQPLAEEGHDEVLDLADQLLAQLDAKENMVPNQPASGPSPSSGIASGNATASTASNAPLAAPQPINMADANINAQSFNANVNSQHNMEGGSSLQHASSRQSATSSTSAISSTSTTVPIHSSTSASSRSRHSSSSSVPKPTGLGAKIKQALSPSHRDEASSSSVDTMDVSPEGDASSSTHNTSTSPFSPQTYKNRHAIRKEKKKQKEEAMRAEAQAEIEAERANGGTGNKYDAADLERVNIDNICKSWNLELVEMEPDGHCMYSAIADQLTSKKVLTDGDKEKDKERSILKKREREKWDYNTVRKIAADYMRDHMDDFLPYLPAEDVEGQGEGLLSPEGYLKHCDNVENTSEWGSQTEVRIYSRSLQ